MVKLFHSYLEVEFLYLTLNICFMQHWTIFRLLLSASFLAILFVFEHRAALEPDYIHSSFYTTVKAPAKHRHIKISESLVTMIIYSAFTPWTYCTYLPFSNEWMSLRTNNISFLLPSSAAIKWQQQKQCSGFRIRQFAITLDHISPALLTTERLLWDTLGCLFY